MKKILVIVLLTLSNMSWGQTDENHTVNNANFPVALYSGIPDINIPLFTIQTANSNFSLDLKLENSLYAGTNKYFSTRGIGDAWSLNILGSITLKPAESWTNAPINTYDETHYSNLLLDNEDKEGHTTYTYSVLGLTGKFVIEKNGTVFKTRIIEQNDYAEVTVDYTTTNNFFRLISFTIRDKNGMQYIFQHSDKKGTRESGAGVSTIYFGESRTFYLSSIIDKFDNDLLVFHYSGNTPSVPVQVKAYNCELTSFDIVGQGTITLSGLNAHKRTLTYRNLSSELIEKIEFIFFPGFPPFNKLLVTDVRTYSKDENTYKSYNIAYKRHMDVDSTKVVFGFPHVICAEMDYTEDYLRFDHGAVEKIITPEGGVVFYEYETNTTGYIEHKLLNNLTPGTPTYNSSLHPFQNNIRDNYTFEPVTLIYNSVDGGYHVDLADYVPFLPDLPQTLYVEYKTDKVEILPPSPIIPGGKYYIPTLKVATYTNPNVILPYIDVEQNTCFPGKPILKTGENVNFFLEIEPQYHSYYQYVRAYYKKSKDNSDLVYFSYSVAPRIKRIKSFSQDVSSINATDYVVSEQLFKYSLFDQPKTSSGYTKYFGAGSNPHPFYEADVKDFAHIMSVYKNVTVEIPGNGKINYEYDDALDGGTFYITSLSNKTKMINKIEKYNAQNQLLESIDLERNFLEPSTELGSEIKTQSIVTYEKATTESFENGASSGLRAITESTFDTLTRHLTHRKITDSGTGDTFEEAYTYQKLGNAFYQTGVEKTKNNQALNRSVYAYQQYENTQVYNLKAVSTAKENRPLQVEREITRHDTYGNITGYKTKDGMLVSQIWGYNNSMLVAELKNVDPAVLYTSAHATVRNNIANYSNQSGAGYSEADLTTALNSLRNTFPDAYITTYTYKPLVGITSVTDANGRKETYQYDSFNRLWRVLNHEGLIVKEYEYNIKN